MRIKASLLIFAGLLALLTACAKPAATLTAAELLDLGEKYLLELDYEQALVQFMKVIEIDPMNPRGYTGAAEAYVGLGDPEKAVAILEKGLTELPDNLVIQNSFNELSPKEPEIPLETALVEVNEPREYLYGFLTQYESSGYEGIVQMIESDEFKEILAQIGELPFLLLNDTGDYGIGLYGQFIYIGDYVDNSRSGFGIWFDYDIDYYDTQYEGAWVNDKPNGDGVVKFDIGNGWDTTSGTLVGGLWNGTIQNTHADGGVCTIEMVNGKRVTIGTVEDNDGNEQYISGYCDGNGGHLYAFAEPVDLDVKRGVIPFANNPY